MAEPARKGRPRPRVQSRAEIAEQERGRTKAAAEEAARRGRRRTDAAQFSKTALNRMQQLVEELGGAAQVQRRTGIPASTVKDWFGLTPGGGFRQGPTMMNLWLLARESCVSTDWLLGFDVPRRREDRELVADLAQQLEAHVVRAIASRAAEAWSDVATHERHLRGKVPSGSDMLEAVIAQYSAPHTAAGEFLARARKRARDKQIAPEQQDAARERTIQERDFRAKQSRRGQRGVKRARAAFLEEMARDDVEL